MEVTRSNGGRTRNNGGKTRSNRNIHIYIIIYITRIRRNRNNKDGIFYCYKISKVVFPASVLSLVQNQFYMF